MNTLYVCTYIEHKVMYVMYVSFVHCFLNLRYVSKMRCWAAVLKYQVSVTSVGAITLLLIVQTQKRETAAGEKIIKLK